MKPSRIASALALALALAGAGCASKPAALQPVAMIAVAASIYAGVNETIRLVFSLIIVALGLYRLSDIVRE